jgi:cellulose synthase/poly-beta-1,6-N-acetylglucosamine synthase-like glycosyltransferase
MEAIISGLIFALAVVLAVPVGVFVIEVVAAIALSQRESSGRATGGVRPRVAILVPAHNESTGLLPTLSDVRSQLHANDRLIVVADNCGDDTAAIATSAGAEVLERRDPTRHGKGYALDYGLRHLALDPPEIVIVIDADCRVATSAIDRLATACAIAGRPAQALYLMMAPEPTPINYQVAQFAWRVKNWVRPLGLSAFGLPCQLVGTGMAFPWDIIRAVDLASGHIVEDLNIGLDLALARRAALFCPSALVTSSFPLSAQGARTQRQRWEHGHIGMILTAAAPLMWTALVRGNFNLLALTLDLMVPPLSLLIILLFGMIVVSFGLSFHFSSAALAVSIGNLLVFASAVVLAWAKYGRDILPPRAMGTIGGYILGKLPLYRRALSGNAVDQWIRTGREKSEPRFPNDSRFS